MEQQAPYQQPVLEPVLKTQCCGNHDDGGGKFMVGMVCLVIGLLLGWGIVNWSSGYDRKADDAKAKNELAKVAEQSWGDGVMWGALAMKNMSDQQVPTKEFGTVLGVAKELKAKFVEEMASKSVSPKAVPPPAPLVAPQPAHRK